jgi:two-component system nitrate/nitrite response regulator NarL
MNTATTTRAIRVMCVDDSRDILDLLLATLSRVEGIRCDRGFSDAQSLLAHLSAQPYNSSDLPDVIVLDWSMPGVSPKTALMVIAQGWPSVKVVVFTAHPREMVLEEAMAAGAWDVVEKNQGMQALIAAITRSGNGDALP